MPAVTIRNLSEEVHLALKVCAADDSRSAEAEMRAILEIAVRPVDRIRLGSVMFALSREAGSTNADFDGLDKGGERKPAEPMGFE